MKTSLKPRYTNAVFFWDTQDGDSVSGYMIMLNSSTVVYPFYTLMLVTMYTDTNISSFTQMQFFIL